MSVFDYWDFARLALGIVIVACNWGVWRGVALEESFVPWDQETGRTLLVRSLALEFFFAMVLVVVDTAGSISQKAEIASLNAQIAPRRLLAGQQADVTMMLKPFATGKSVLISSYALDPESAILGFQITEVLKKAGLSTNDEGLMTVQGNGSIALGIHITGKDAQLVHELLKALGKYDVVSPREPFQGGFVTMGRAMPIGPPPDAAIFVGVKPIVQ